MMLLLSLMVFQSIFFVDRLRFISNHLISSLMGLYLILLFHKFRFSFLCLPNLLLFSASQVDYTNIHLMLLLILILVMILLIANKEDYSDLLLLDILVVMMMMMTITIFLVVVTVVKRHIPFACFSKPCQTPSIETVVFSITESLLFFQSLPCSAADDDEEELKNHLHNNNSSKVVYHHRHCLSL